MPAGEVISSYHDLWRVEQSFRMNKTDLRPMFHRQRDAIEAHLAIVFTALAVTRRAQQLTDQAIGNIVKTAPAASFGDQRHPRNLPPRYPRRKADLLDRLQHPQTHALNK